MSETSRPARLTVGLIGLGRVGAVLGAALARAGHHVVAASGVSEASRRRRDALLPGVPLRPADEVAAAASGLLLLAVPDDVLPGLIDGLAATGVVPAGALVAHVCGRYGPAVLDPLTRVGALPLALHPVLTFTGTEVDVARLAGARFGVTAPAALRPAAEALVIEMGAEPVWVDEAFRELYHAALAWGANFLTTVVAQAADLLGRAGIADPMPMLAPLLTAALDNALRSSDRALTGPVARGDAGSVAAHLDVLAAAAPEVLPAYLALSRLTAERATASGLLRADNAGPLLAVLARHGPSR
ncbi:MAG TPA: Rossmann-like and DUF2520 domain-containing protein [Mycobacteriales bacterium]|nr:Rossmann-like and DUF2520 domain-containing protein [Mycobacteriales bacterium]